MLRGWAADIRTVPADQVRWRPLPAHRLCGGEQIANFHGLRDGTGELIASRMVTEVEQSDHLAVPF